MTPSPPAATSRVGSSPLLCIRHLDDVNVPDNGGRGSKEPVGPRCQPRAVTEKEQPGRAFIREVQGRHANGGQRGMQAISQLVLEHDDGRIVTANGLFKSPTQKTGLAELVCAIPRARYSDQRPCPICLEAPADSREHVPSKAFGGVVMTYTCTRCNSEFGSKTEASLQDWFDNRTTVRMWGDEDGPPIAMSKVLLLDMGDKNVAMMPDKGSAGIGFEGLSGASRMSFTEPPSHEVKIGLLKSTYLAACLHMGGNPNQGSGEAIRAELHAVVKAASRSSVVMGDYAKALQFFRTGTAPKGPPLGLYRNSDGVGGVKHFISLAGTILVAWPFPEFDPENFWSYENGKFVWGMQGGRRLSAPEQGLGPREGNE